MAKGAYPDVIGLGPEIDLKVINSLAASGVNGLFNGVRADAWNTSDVTYWQNGNHNIEFVVEFPCNIWRSGTTSWITYTSKFNIFKEISGVYVDITAEVEQSTSQVNEKQWEKTISNLQPGKYKFVATGLRLDSEWYVERVDAPIKTRFKDMSVGDMIKCRYSASVTNYGVFSDIGESTAIDIPTNSIYIPDGCFYFIHVGYDYLGRMKLIADRNIQTGISWDTLNSEGIISGKEVIIHEYVNKANNENLLHEIGSGLTLYAGTANSVSDGKISNDIRNDKYGLVTQGSTSNKEIVTIDFTEQKIIKHIKIKHFKGESTWLSMHIKNFKLQGSNDKSSWKDVFTGVTGSSSAGQVDIYNFDNSKAFRYYRIFVIDNWGYSGYMSLGDIELSENRSDKLNKDSQMSIRLLTGGVSITDKDNEWDKIIVESDLNTIITSGDNSIWHYKDLSSWTSTTGNTPANRITRGGNAAASTTNAPTGLVTTTVSNTVGFRPVLLIEELAVGLFLVKQEGKYYSIKPEYYNNTNQKFNSITLTEGLTPNKKDIEMFGFSDISILLSNMTVAGDTFRPIDVLEESFEIKYYEED